MPQEAVPSWRNSRAAPDQHWTDSCALASPQDAVFQKSRRGKQEGSRRGLVLPRSAFSTHVIWKSTTRGLPLPSTGHRELLSCRSLPLATYSKKPRAADATASLCVSRATSTPAFSIFFSRDFGERTAWGGQAEAGRVPLVPTAPLARRPRVEGTNTRGAGGHARPFKRALVGPPRRLG